MTSQPSQQTIAIHIWLNIAQSKDKQTMEFGQLKDHNKRNTFLQNYAKNDAERPVPDLFLFFEKALPEVKASGLRFCCKIFRQNSIWHAINTNCIELWTINPEICSSLVFQKRIGEQILHYILCMIFQRNCFKKF